MRDLARLAAIAIAFALSNAALAADTTETKESAASATFAEVKAMVDAGKYDAALPELRRLDQSQPNNPDILNLIGFSLRKTGHPGQALDYYSLALAAKPDHLGANEYLGELYVELKQPEKAKQRLEVLQRACGACEEYLDLKAKIDQLAKAG